MTSKFKDPKSPVAKVTCSLPYRSIEQRICYESPHNCAPFVKVSDFKDSELTLLASFTVATERHNPLAPRYEVVGIWVDSMLKRAAAGDASYYALFMKSLNMDLDAPYLVCVGIEDVETFATTIPLTVDKLIGAEKRLFRGTGSVLQKEETQTLLRYAKDAEKEGRAGRMDASELHPMAAVVRRWGDEDITWALEAFRDELLLKRS
jgi:hypothetical protein